MPAALYKLLGLYHQGLSSIVQMPLWAQVIPESILISSWGIAAGGTDDAEFSTSNLKSISGPEVS